MQLLRLSLVAVVCTVACATLAKDLILPAYANFAVAGLSGMTAWLVIHPGDVIKSRMQIAAKKAGDDKPGEGAVAIAKQIVRDEGVKGLYSGLSAGLMRQATYTTFRLGFYDTIGRFVLALADKHNKGGLFKFLLRQVVGAVTGAVASFLSCPVEVCLVRMQADGKLPPSKRRGYRNIFDALLRIGREEGVAAYWTGASTTMIRAAVVSVTQVAAYDQAKTSLSPKLEGFKLHAAAGTIAAFTFCTLSMPFDTVKTRQQNAEKPAKATSSSTSAAAAAPQTSENTFAAIARVSREEGVAALWNGYPPYLVSKGILTILLFIIKEKYSKLFLTIGGLPEPIADFSVKY